MQVLVTDHHLPGRELPDADAMVNPQPAYCNFPSKSLAGVRGRLLSDGGPQHHLRQSGWYERQGLRANVVDYLDSVAPAPWPTVALDGNNRILVHQGCSGSGPANLSPRHPGVGGRVGPRRASPVRADLGFALGPRLSAVGRLDDMSSGSPVCSVTTSIWRASSPPKWTASTRTQGIEQGCSRRRSPLEQIVFVTARCLGIVLH